MRAGIVVLLLAAVTLTTGSLDGQERRLLPKAKVVSLSNDSNDLPLLSGPPDSAGMHSGMVTLLKEQTVGKHNTKSYEEILVVLQGEGEMILEGQPPLAFHAPAAVYCPPRTAHDVRNKGSAPLRYVYVAAKASETSQ